LSGRNEETMRWEKRLGISTGAGDYEKEDAHHARYEPTDYGVLERLAGCGYIQKKNVLADYGCGKGRVSFFMHYAAGCRSIGVEYDPVMYEQAQRNLQSCTVRGARKGGVSFVCANAEEWNAEQADRFYFFNPFSLKILRSVLERVFESYYARPREIYLFFYYPLDEYVSYLMQEDGLFYVGEVDCRDLYDYNDQRERILIFSLGYELRLEDRFYLG